MQRDKKISAFLLLTVLSCSFGLKAQERRIGVTADTLISPSQAGLTSRPSQARKDRRSKKAVGFGVKAGPNFIDVTGMSSVGGNTAGGFNASIFYSPNTSKILGYRAELEFSRQKYSYSSGGRSNVSLNYLVLPQYTMINITRWVSLEIGGQLAYLLNATADSSANASGQQGTTSVSSLTNTFIFSLAGGVEIHPYHGLLVGARYNVSLSNTYKNNLDGVPDPFGNYKNINFKSNVLQFVVGWKF